MLLGDYRVEVIPDCEFRLDGGAMFGVVPRVVWERVCPPDDLNRVTLTCNCLFIDTGKKKVLIETGMGEKWTTKQIAMYGITRKKRFAESLFEITGSHAEDIDIVINTHLHFDHAGGNTTFRTGGATGAQASRLPGRVFDGRDVTLEALPDESSDHSSASPGPPLAGETPALQSQFPNARYLVSKSEFCHAESPHERDRASYLSENWLPLIDSKQIDLMPDSYEPIEGLTVEQVRGHSETMQTIKLTRGGETLFGFFDMVPTRHHIPLPWIMSYDLFPTETMEFKRNILPRAVEENWICHFYHDVEMPLGRLVEIDGRLTATPYVESGNNA